MTLNGGYTYREQLDGRARGHTALSYLARRYSHSPAAEWRARLERGEVWLGRHPAAADTVLHPGDVLEWHRPPWEEAPVPLTYRLIYADAALLAVSKPAGLPTLPGGGFLEHTLLARVRADWPEATPLHRLGRGTSGLVLCARTPGAAARLARDWREGQVDKVYRALAVGMPAWDRADLTTPIGPVPHPRLGEVYAASAAGRASRSVAHVLERRPAPGQTLLAVELHTGRPHQIRIHLAAAGHPLVGDPLYAPGGGVRPGLPGLPGDGGYRLHAEWLRLQHPSTGARLTLCAPPPPELCRTGGS